MSEHSPTKTYRSPPYRKVRAFAFDPGISRKIETFGINEVTMRVPWDTSPDDYLQKKAGQKDSQQKIGPGPVDSYLEVVDFDPASRVFYHPVDLMDPHLLAQDGLPPSEGNPQFHQQMVYAVARTTIGHFESALGRRILWSPRWTKVDEEYREEYIPRLRIYPHAFRDANAYYNRDKKALLFGYFPAPSADSGCTMPGETIFTCLSHDIIAHETTHAIIDGLHPRFFEPSNADVPALHEALADVVALFQHFTYPEVLKHQIARTRGDLEKQNMLGELAYQFGHAIGLYGALRDAIGGYDKDHKWIPGKPDPEKIRTTIECHDRGSIFVAAIFDAYLAIYTSRIRDLIRIASGGTGILPEGEIHPDLVNRLSQEAAKTARHMLQMCIRALDYSPCVDPEIGDYLRALITADRDLVNDDPHNYRLAVIEAFRQWGMYPRDVWNLSIDSLAWPHPDPSQQIQFRSLFNDTDWMKEIVSDWDTKKDRKKIQETAKNARRHLQEIFMRSESVEAAEAAGLLMKNPSPSVYLKGNRPAVEVHSIRPARRTGPDFQNSLELVIEVTQRRRGYLDPNKQAEVDSDTTNAKPPRPDFILRGGCTLIVDPLSGEVRYCISKSIMDGERLNRMRDFIHNSFTGSLYATYFGNPYLEYYQQRVDEARAGEPSVNLFALHNQLYRREA